MKLLILVNLILLFSCSSLPEGKMVMREKINEDKKRYLIEGKREEVGYFDEFLTVYIHPQIVNGGVLLKEGVFYVPVKKGAMSWNSILEESDKE